MKLDFESLEVETFEIELRCQCCGKPSNLDIDGMCEVCGPVAERYDYRSL